MDAKTKRGDNVFPPYLRKSNRRDDAIRDASTRNSTLLIAGLSRLPHWTIHLEIDEDDFMTPEVGIGNEWVQHSNATDTARQTGPQWEVKHSIAFNLDQPLHFPFLPLTLFKRYVSFPSNLDFDKSPYFTNRIMDNFEGSEQVDEESAT